MNNVMNADTWGINNTVGNNPLQPNNQGQRRASTSALRSGWEDYTQADNLFDTIAIGGPNLYSAMSDYQEHEPEGYYDNSLLALITPCIENPGYYCDPARYIRVSASILLDGFQPSKQSLRAIIAYRPGEVKTVFEARVRKAFPKYDMMTGPEKRGVWSRILQIGKKVRQERVAQLLTDLRQLGLDLDVTGLKVHRVAHSFEINLSEEHVTQLLKLYQKRQFTSFIRVQVDKIARTYV